MIIAYITPTVAVTKTRLESEICNLEQMVKTIPKNISNIATVIISINISMIVLNI